MAGEHVVIMQGRYGADMTRIISLNESALYLWNELQGKEFDTEEGRPAAHRPLRDRLRNRPARRCRLGRETKECRLV